MNNMQLYIVELRFIYMNSVYKTLFRTHSIEANIYSFSYSLMKNYSIRKSNKKIYHSESTKMLVVLVAIFQSLELLTIYLLK